MAKSIVLKDVQSPERLLDETALFLHRVVADLPRERRVVLPCRYISPYQQRACVYAGLMARAR